MKLLVYKFQINLMIAKKNVLKIFLFVILSHANVGTTLFKQPVLPELNMLTG